MFDVGDILMPCRSIGERPILITERKITEIPTFNEQKQLIPQRSSYYKFIYLETMVEDGAYEIYIHRNFILGA